MRSWLLLGLVTTTFVLVAFPGCGHGAEPGRSSLEEEGDPQKGDLALSRFPRTTLRQRHRIGSFSALSRGLMANMSKLDEVETPWQEREANRTHGACWGCCGTRLPDRNGSRQPSKGDSGPLGGTPPPPHPPKRNATKGYHRPGAYTPMGKLRRSDQALDTGKGVSFFWVKLNGHQGSNATLDRCQGCCGRNSTTVAKLPERKDEDGKGSPSPGGGPIRHPWKPVLEREVPNKRPSQKGEDSRWSSFPVDPIEPWRHQRGP